MMALVIGFLIYVLPAIAVLAVFDIHSKQKKISEHLVKLEERLVAIQNTLEEKKNANTEN
jgi:hypothetical protein